jgi:NADH-quinone oxidoreductase subunit M
VYLGPEYKGPHREGITPITDREALIGGVLLALCIVLGVYPELMFAPMRGSVNMLVDNLANVKDLITAAPKTVGL